MKKALQVCRKYKKEHYAKNMLWSKREKNQWVHEKCFQDGAGKTHIFKHGTEVGDLCYCGRKKYPAYPISSYRDDYFIEAR